MMIDRNEWFQRFVLSQLKADGLTRNNQPLTFFAYSYAAEKVFKFAKELGWRTVLGQIDPGPAEERLMKQLHFGGPDNVSDWEPAPSEYWEKWNSECELADHIVVNSTWSRDALISEGINPQKIRVIALGFEESVEARMFERQYPDQFSSSRPMRVLFLGQVGLRKGAARLFDAVAMLSEQPIEFWFVGPLQVAVPEALRGNKNVKWFDVVPRDAVAEYYRDADVFIFPTLSDGFGLTQLEAQSWKLPVIASLYCGSVVRHDVNGLILPEVSRRAIADALLSLLRSPEKLRQMSSRSEVRDEFSLTSLASSLLSL
jgi:glycosyltransferase involved in cell wall biosynthesis